MSPVPQVAPSGGGARRAAARRPTAHRSAVLAALLLAAATVLVLLAPGHPDPAGTAPPADVPVQRVLLGCPGSTPESAGRPQARVGSAPVGDDGTAPSVRVRTEQGETSLELTRGELAVLPATGGLRLESEDGAAGLFAVQDAAGGATLAGTRCAPAAATWWFSGAGGTLAHSSDLVLSNVDPAPAVVDLRLFGADGPVDAPGTRGIPVPAGERVVLSLAELVPQGQALTVGVSATRGRVVAAVADRYADRLGQPPGSAWLPAQAARRLHRLPGLVPDADHTLLLANPGPNEALVDLEVSSGTGTFTPTGETQLRVPPGTVVAHDVTGLLAEDAGALVVRASRPVLATVRTTTRADTAYLAGADRLVGPAAAVVHPEARTELTLTAGPSGAAATVTAYDERGAVLDTSVVEVAPGATARSTPARRAAYLVVEPGRGTLHGSVTWSAGASLAVLPLAELPVTVSQPAVEPAS